MKRFSLLMLLSLALCQGVRSQGMRYDNFVLKPLNTGGLTAVSGALITVCTSAGTGTPCTPKVANIYSDEALTTPITGTGGAGTTNSDSGGNFGFYAAPGSYIVTVTGTGITSYTIKVVLPLISKNLGAVQFADQYTTTATVAAPVNAPALYSASSGGTVAANSYRCEVTFIGATSGETTASPASAAVTTTGAVSILYCNQNEVPPPAGALTYNVYWQTGASSYFQGHTSVALGVNDAQTSTPPTSGTTPPGANTAIGILPSVQAAIGGAGTEIIPSTVSSTLGAAGNPTSGQTLFDYRTGQIFNRPAAGKGHYISAPGLFNNTQEDLFRISINGFNSQSEMNLLFNPTFNAVEGVSAGGIVPNSSTTGQFNGIAGYAIDQRTNPITPSVGVFGVGNAQALNARAWGGNFVGTDQGSASLTTNLYGEESDCFVGIVGTLCTAHLAEAFWLGGIQPTTSIAFRVGQPQGSAANARWSMGYRCDTNATFSTDGNNACLFMFPVATGVSQNSQGIEFISTRSDGASPGGSLFLLPPGDLQFTSSAGGHGFTLGSTGMPLNFTEGTAPGTAAASVDVCYGDSTAHALECSYNNGTFGVVPLLNRAQTWTAAQTHTGAAIIPDQTSGITGTTTNNNANAGAVGEYVQSVLATGSSVTLATGVTSNVTSISLTAGDWDVTGAVDFTFGATTSYTNLIGSVSSTSATIGGQDSKFDFETPAAVPTAGADATYPVPVVRFSLSGTTTVFLVAQGTFTVSTLKAYGTIRARRIR